MSSEILEAGTYDIIHGAERTILTIASEVAPPCVGEALARGPKVDANAAGEDQPTAW